MSPLRIFAAFLACALTTLGSPILPSQDTPLETFTNLISRSSQTVNNPLSLTQNLFSTQILAKSPGGQVVFDQTLPFAFGDPSIQALVLQGSLALNGIGATSILGPSLLSSVLVSEGSSVVTSPTGSREDQFLVGDGTTTLFGPGVVTIGELVCQSFAITGAGAIPGASYGVPSGCSGGTLYSVGDNETNYNTWEHYLTTNFQNVTTTETFRTTEVYLLQAQDSGSLSAVPEPGTLGMFIACIPILLTLRSRRKN